GAPAQPGADDFVLLGCRSDGYDGHARVRRPARARRAADALSGAQGVFGAQAEFAAARISGMAAVVCVGGLRAYAARRRVVRTRSFPELDLRYVVRRLHSR